MPQRRTQSQLQETVKLALDAGLRRDEVRKVFERALLAEALERAKGNQCHAADALGVHRNTLTRQIEELNLTGLPLAIRQANKQPKLPFMGKRPSGIWVDAPKSGRRMG
jgi:DNA-binding protein Fis